MADVVAAVEKLRVDDRLVTAAEMLLGDVEALLEAVTGLQAVLVRRLRDGYEADATSELYGRSTKRWLVEDQLLTGPEAGRYLRLARQLPAYPATEAAFAAAEINSGHVAAILTALAALPPHLREVVEGHLIDRAREFPPEEIAGFVDELLQLLGVDTIADIRRDRRHNNRGLDLARTLAGTRSLTGTLTPDVGEHLEQALTLAGQPAGPDDHRSDRQRRHDALGAIATAYLAHRQTPSFTGAPRTVIVTIDLQTLEDQLRQAWLTLPSGATITADTARRLACDAEIIPVVLAGTSEVLDIGQASREFTTPIRRAAYTRDRGRCAFPHCTNHPAELHHIVFRRHRGPTALDNAAWLCEYHHWLAHEGGWTLRRHPTGDYHWTGPHGQQRTRHLPTA